MSLLNLSVAEFAAIFSTVTAVLVTLYLLDRSRRRLTAATLRFWKASASSLRQTHKRRIQQPWSLILQLVSIALLLLAIGELVLGSRDRGRDHVLILDTSAWMGARTGHGTLMDEARASALAYVRSLPHADRVLLIRADGLATPAGVLDSNRGAVEQAIRSSRPGSSALNLQQAFDFARQFQRLHTTRPGEIVFAGAGRVGADEPVTDLPANLRVLSVTALVDNLGLRKIGLKRSDEDPSVWQVFVAVRNYGATGRTAPVELRFGGALVGARALALAPNSDQETTFRLRTQAAGLLEARIRANDALPEDDRAALELPSQRPARVVVFSSEPSLLRPVLTANPHVQAEFHPPSEWKKDVQADVLVFDGFAPSPAPTTPSIYLDPPARDSPVRVRSTVAKATLKSWNPEHELGAGLRTKDIEIESGSVFTPEPQDIAVASIEAGPVIVARPGSNGSPKLVVFGFHPVRSKMRYELATPLVFANVLRWMHPDVFRRWELNAGVPGAVAAELGKGVDASAVSVTEESGLPVPYTIDGDRLRFFAGSPGNVRVVEGDREIVYSLTLPGVGETAWAIPKGTHRGVPARNPADNKLIDLWPWLAALGGLGLLTEWMLYGRGQRRVRVVRAGEAGRARLPWRRRKAS
jgi:hypothetical protein